LQELTPVPIQNKDLGLIPPIVKPKETHEKLGSTIFCGSLQLREGKQCIVYDITGRVVEPNKIKAGIYFIEVDGVVTQKVVKVR